LDDRRCEPEQHPPHWGTETCSDGNKPDDACPGKSKQPRYRSKFHIGIVKESKLSREGFVCYSAYNQNKENWEEFPFAVSNTPLARLSNQQAIPTHVLL